MIRYCKNCGERLPEGGAICPHCGQDNTQSIQTVSDFDVPEKKRFFTKKRTILLSVLAVVIGLCIWDIADPPLWIQFESQANKRTILEYVKIHYPGAKIIKQVYRANTFITSNAYDYIIFDWEDVRFSILANDGEIWADTYLDSKASQYIEKNIIDPFFKPRNITATFSCTFPDGKPEVDLTEYNGLLSISITMVSNNSTSNPQQVGWLYDFYCYFQEYSNLNNYNVYISYTVGSSNHASSYTLSFTQNSVYETEEDFYESFNLYA